MGRSRAMVGRATVRMPLLKVLRRDTDARVMRIPAERVLPGAMGSEEVAAAGDAVLLTSTTTTSCVCSGRFDASDGRARFCSSSEWGGGS